MRSLSSLEAALWRIFSWFRLYKNPWVTETSLSPLNKNPKTKIKKPQIMKKTILVGPEK
jgi:hypothetical protein